MSAESGTLFLVATPIGNLGDITLRAIDVLRDCQHVVAEDTRRSRKLLTHLQLDCSRLSRLDAHASDEDLQRVLGWLLEGQSVALITDAGCPSVSDPGTPLVRLAALSHVPVTAIPGASAVTVAVGVSGLVDSAFYFGGFLPRETSERAQFVGSLARRAEPCVLFEAPHRLNACLRELAQAMPSRQAVIGRELTKLHEELLRGTLEELAQLQREWLGEITLVLGPWTQPTEASLTDEQIDERIDQELAQGVHTRTVAERVSAWSGRARRDVYARVLERKSSTRK